MRISFLDGAIDWVRIDSTEDDLSFHTLIITDHSGMLFSESELASPAALLASLSERAFSASWRLDTQPGATAIGESAIPEPKGALLFALGAWLLGPARLRTRERGSASSGRTKQRGQLRSPRR
jgi:hypothetical protein